jgi:Sulfatase
MHEAARTAGTRGNTSGLWWPWRALHLVALWTVSLVEPVVGAIGDTPEYFTARDLGRTEALLLYGVMVFALPAAMLLAEGLIGRLLGARAQRLTHLVMIGGLAGLIGLRAAKSAELSTPLPDGWLFVVLAGALAGVAFAVVYARFGVARTFVSALGFAPLILLPAYLDDVPGSPPAPELQASNDTPVLVVVFDEFPTTMLVDGKRRLDTESFPNFGRLAADSTWYRNATTVWDVSESAVAAVLTGQAANPGPPDPSTFPENLLSVRRERKSEAIEPWTGLCYDAVCQDLTPRRGNDADTLHELVKLGAITVWPRNFPLREPALEDLGPERLDSAQHAQRLISSLDAQGGIVRFAHLILPHRPWLYQPSGARYASNWIDADHKLSDPYLGAMNPPWPELTKVGEMRHIVQAQFADTIVGRIIDRLKELDVYDETMLVVVADHGARYTAGEPIRALTTADFASIAGMPLFVKYPGQTEGEVSDRLARTSDIAPTVVDVIGAGELPSSGESLLRPAATPKELSITTGHLYCEEDSAGEPNCMQTATALSEQFLAQARRAARRKARMFGGPGLPGLYGSPRLLGRPAHTLRRCESRRLQPDEFELLQPPSKVVPPALVFGTVEGPAPEAIAISVAGEVVATAEPYQPEDGAFEFMALLPEAAAEELNGSLPKIHLISAAADC